MSKIFHKHFNLPSSPKNKPNPIHCKKEEVHLTIKGKKMKAHDFTSVPRSSRKIDFFFCLCVSVCSWVCVYTCFWSMKPIGQLPRETRKDSERFWDREERSRVWGGNPLFSFLSLASQEFAALGSRKEWLSLGLESAPVTNISSSSCYSFWCFLFPSLQPNDF